MAVNVHCVRSQTCFRGRVNVYIQVWLVPCWLGRVGTAAPQRLNTLCLDASARMIGAALLQ